jgi:hypothetical protein
VENDMIELKCLKQIPIRTPRAGSNSASQIIDTTSIPQLEASDTRSESTDRDAERIREACAAWQRSLFKDSF